MNTDVKAAGRILDMLEMFAATTGSMGVNRVAEKLGIPRVRAQSFLSTLTSRGYLARVGGEYMLPPELRGGSWAGGARARLMLLAAPALRQLLEKSEESAYLSVLAGDEIQYLAKELSVRDVRYDGSLALRRPVYCTASGLVMLAAAGVEVARVVLGRVDRVKHTPQTVVDLDELMRWIGRIRRSGYAATYDGYIMGAAGIAAPVFGPTGEAIAALALGGPSARFRTQRRQLSRAVMAQAHALSRRLSGEATEDSG